MFSPARPAPTARLLAASGIRRARVEIGWGEIDYDHPDRLWRPERHRTILKALVRRGIRPLILLNSNEGMPTAQRDNTLVTASGASQGERQVLLSSASASLVVPGRTGFDDLTGFRAAEVLITGVNSPAWRPFRSPSPSISRRVLTLHPPSSMSRSAARSWRMEARTRGSKQPWPAGSPISPP